LSQQHAKLWSWQADSFRRFQFQHRLLRSTSPDRYCQTYSLPSRRNWQVSRSLSQLP
jgi:hypothetical protein